MDFYEALLAKALRASLKPDHEAFLRHVKRFVSKTFHIPLHEIDDLDEEFVLTAYYEEAIAQMSDEDREDLLDKLVETDVERLAREQNEKSYEEKDDEFLNKLNQEVMSGAVHGPPKEKPKPKKWSPKAKPIKVPPKSVDKAPPDIHLTFSDIPQEIPAEWADMESFSSSRKK